MSGIFNCQRCGLSFQRKGKKIGKWCSLNCKFPNRHLKIECLNCEKLFHPRFDEKLCSVKCKNNNQKGKFIGIKSPRWTGGVSRTNTGYLLVNHGPNQRTLAHRLVMSRCLGRGLSSDEIVHHINGDKTDNRLENLSLTNRSDHILLHLPEMLSRRRSSF